MNTLDYAVATLGNHDFNYGLEALERAYAQARFPVVCCNVRKSDGSPWFPPSVVIERAFIDDVRNAAAAQSRRDRRCAAANRPMGRGPCPRTLDHGRHRRSRARGAWRTQGPRRSGRRALSLRDFTARLDPGGGERGTGPRQARRRRRAVPRPSALAVARRGFCRFARRRHRARNDPRQARCHGWLLGQPSRNH